MSIDVLPDEVLLEIFDFYVVPQGPFRPDKRETEAWQSLVHMCRRWRSIVFGSSRRLNLQLFCSPRTPVRDTIDIWPELPLHIEVDWLSLPMEDSPSPSSDGEVNLRGGEGGDGLPSKVADDVNQKEVDNIVAALEHRDRVDDKQQIVSAHVRIHKFRRRRGWYPRYLHRSATPEGQGCRSRQGGRRTYSPCNVSIRYVT